MNNGLNIKHYKVKSFFFLLKLVAREYLCSYKCPNYRVTISVQDTSTQEVSLFYFKTLLFHWFLNSQPHGIYLNLKWDNQHSLVRWILDCCYNFCCWIFCLLLFLPYHPQFLSTSKTIWQYTFLLLWAYLKHGV